VKKQLILLTAGLILVASLFFFGRTSEPKKQSASEQQSTVKSFDVHSFIKTTNDSLGSERALYISELQNNISRGAVTDQQVKAYETLAGFYRDSIKIFEPYAFYTSEAAKLDNSEKKLTFAARLFLDRLRAEHDESKLNWLTSEAIQLFEKALALNPNNDELRIGLGSAYVFGRGRSGNPQETMKGIQELLAVARKDSTNMRAQLVLGIGGYVSGQYDKAIERFSKVIKAEPSNLEAIAFLADTYAAKGDKAEAIKWYNISKRLVNDPHYTQEVDERIKSLQ